MKIALLAVLLLSLVSCKSELEGDFKAYESIQIKDKVFTPGTYNLSLKKKRKKIVLKIGDEKLKLKFSKNFKNSDDFIIRAQEIGHPFTIEGKLFTEFSESYEEQVRESCTVNVAYRSRLVCARNGNRPRNGNRNRPGNGRARSGSRNCWREMQYRTYQGTRYSTYSYWTERVIAQAQVHSDRSDGRVLGDFYADDENQKSELVSSTRCQIF